MPSVLRNVYDEILLYLDGELQTIYRGVVGTTQKVAGREARLGELTRKLGWLADEAWRPRDLR